MTLYFAPLGTEMPADDEWTEIGCTEDAIELTWEPAEGWDEFVSTGEWQTERSITVAFEVTDAMREYLTEVNVMFDVLFDEDWDVELERFMYELENYPPPGYEPLDLAAMCVWGSIMGRKLA